MTGRLKYYFAISVLVICATFWIFVKGLGSSIKRIWLALKAAPKLPRRHWEAFPYKKAIVPLVITFVVCLTLLDPLVTHFTDALPISSSHLFGIITDLAKVGFTLIPCALVVIMLAISTRMSLSQELAFRVRQQLVWWFSFGAIVTLSSITATLLKYLIGRARPNHTELMNKLEFHPFAFDSDFASLPSGHSTTAGALAMALIINFPSHTRAWIWLGALLALSRVVVTAHFPSDAVAGFGLGAVATWVLYFHLAQREVGYEVLASGHIRRRVCKRGGVHSEGIMFWSRFIKTFTKHIWNKRARLRIEARRKVGEKQ